MTRRRLWLSYTGSGPIMGRGEVGYRDEVGLCPGFRLGGELFLLRGILPVDRLGVGSVMDLVVGLFGEVRNGDGRNDRWATGLFTEASPL